YAGLWNTDPRRLESTLSEARTLCGLSDVSSIHKALFQVVHGFYRLLSGDVADSRRELEAISAQDGIGALSDHPWLLAQFHFLQAAAAHQDAAWLERLTEALSRRGAGETQCYPAAMGRFLLGVARLAQGRVGEARRLAEAALDFGSRSGAAAPEHHIRMLMAQIHSETGADEAAMAMLEDWTGVWKERGYHLYVVTAYLEIARILIRREELDGARRAYDRAARRWVFGPAPHALNRSRDFVRDIRAALDRKPPPGRPFRAQSQPLAGASARIPEEAPAVAIETFGGLRIHIAGNAIDGDRWRGQKTKDLLKALIVFGGADVSSERIMDALWPETDGDQAAKNLKVTLFRLRRLGCQKGETPLAWIRVRNKRITLLPDICRVDVFRFREGVARGMETDMDVEKLRNAIDLYKGDFLPGDRSADWIVECRRRLRSEYAEAAARMGERLLRMARPEAAATLQSALEKVGLDADLYALLIQAHLDLEQPGKAKAVFVAAAEKFQSELGLDPDPKLLRIARDGGIL
ncbi:MAG: BTAD domain-containing putative transcriptional regulator, partial [Desulfococcaceae bacterium]